MKSNALALAIMASEKILAEPYCLPSKLILPKASETTNQLKFESHAKTFC